MADLFELEITTPERQFYKDQVEMVVLPAASGELGILAHHAPLVTVLDSGILRIKKEDKWSEAATAEGYAMIRDNRVLVLSQTVEWPEEIDVNRAREAEERAKERLRQRQSRREFILTKASLARAMARLRVTRDDSINH